MSKNRFFAPVSIVVLGALAALFTAVGCTGGNRYVESGEFESAVAPDSNEVTFENYRDRRILIVAPSGNQNPKLSWETLNSRENMPEKTWEKFGSMDTATLKAELNKRFVESLQSIASDPQTVVEIRNAGKLYGIDPALIVGNILGEHVYNTKLVMLAQDKVMEGMISTWATKWSLHFASSGISLSDLLKEAPFARCETAKSVQSDYWDCVNSVYESNYRGKSVNGRDFGSSSLKFTFFNPIRSGLTYGLGQLDPIRALMVADRVNKISGLPYVTVDNPVEIYKAILNPRTSVHYIAANIVVSLEIYRKIAAFDISQNLGLVSTLYNLGKEKHFATLRYRDTMKSLKSGRKLEMPVESYYGFLINEKEKEIRRFVETGRAQ